MNLKPNRESRRKTQTGPDNRDIVLPNPKLKLFDQCREILRLKHYSYRTEQTYLDWIRRYVRFCRQPWADSAEQSVDYPDFGADVARRVAAEPGVFGLLVCGTGIGISMAANKIAGARAAVVTNEFTATATRAHNDANIICLGERVTESATAHAALMAFRKTAFEGGRHQRRVDKLRALES